MSLIQLERPVGLNPSRLSLLVWTQQTMNFPRVKVGSHGSQTTGTCTKGAIALYGLIFSGTQPLHGFRCQGLLCRDRNVFPYVLIGCSKHTRGG